MGCPESIQDKLSEIKAKIHNQVDLFSTMFEFGVRFAEEEFADVDENLRKVLIEKCREVNAEWIEKLKNEKFVETFGKVALMRKQQLISSGQELIIKEKDYYFSYLNWNFTHEKMVEKLQEVQERFAEDEKIITQMKDIKIVDPVLPSVSSLVASSQGKL